MSQKLVQSQSMQQVQTLSPQQVLQVRLLEMPVSELEQRVKNELIDNGALEESLGSPEDADTSSEDVYDGTVLARLQTFDPPGIGARDLRECLLLQLRRDEHRGSRQKQLEYEIIDKLFDEFTHKRWDRIAARLHLTEAECERLQRDLKKLNPRPGSAMGEVVGHNYQQIVPDFAVETDDDGGITLSFNKGDVPELRISPSFMEILHQVDTGRAKMSRPEREALQYTRQKIEKAQGFIEAVKQRRRTLTAVMQAIIDLQRPFFLEGDETLLRPMILKDVAERTGLDISTVSRAANSKYVETHYGTYPLKWFFSDGYVTDDGQEIATRKIQAALKDLVEAEDKKKPLSDEALTAMLNEKGFPIARRTVAKYREQLGIPVARLRK